jgi:hypothetical protein
MATVDKKNKFLNQKANLIPLISLLSHTHTMLFLRRVHSHKKKLGRCSDEQCSYQNVVKKSENFLTPLSYTGKYFSVLRVHGKYFP